jgi:hypothetical protein
MFAVVNFTVTHFKNSLHHLPRIFCLFKQFCLTFYLKFSCTTEREFTVWGRQKSRHLDTLKMLSNRLLQIYTSFHIFKKKKKKSNGFTVHPLPTLTNSLISVTSSLVLQCSQSEGKMTGEWWVWKCDTIPVFATQNEVDKRKTHTCMIIHAHSVCPKLEAQHATAEIT